MAILVNARKVQMEPPRLVQQRPHLMEIDWKPHKVGTLLGFLRITGVAG